MSRDKYYQYYECHDGSVCVRHEEAGLWEVLTNGDQHAGTKFVNTQNKFWRPWMREALERERHGISPENAEADELMAFSKLIKKPKAAKK